MLDLKIPPVVLFVLSAAATWGLNEWLPNDLILTELSTQLSLLFMCSGTLIGIFGVFEFYRNSTTVNPHKPEKARVIVESGVYNISRNPMYLGLLIGLISLVIYWGNIYTLLIPILFVSYMNRFQIKPEEEAMKEKFDGAYEQYCEQVRRWI